MLSCLLVLALISPASPRGAEANWKTLAAGEWSKAVSDNRGATLRGRLLVLQKTITSDRRETAVFLDLQDVSEAVGSNMLLYCDLGRTDFRPEYKPGLHCQLQDENKKPIRATGFPFGGGVPLSQWIVLPSQATIRLRCSPFGIHRPDAIALCPDLRGLWVIPDNDPKTYFFSGTFTIDPPDKTPALIGDRIWKGTLELPAVRITNKPQPAPGN